MVRLYTSGLGPFFHKHSPRPIEAGGVAWAGSETAHALVGRHWNEQRAGEIMCTCTFLGVKVKVNDERSA